MGVSEFERVADILRQLQVKPPNVFGAKAHGFRLNPPLAEDAIEDFERQHSIRLPSDFREFISKIGDGGRDPSTESFRWESSTRALVFGTGISRMGL